MVVAMSEKRALCLELLQLESKLAADNARIEEKKAALRAIAAVSDGFNEAFPDLGTVSVSAGSAPKLKGIMPVLAPDLFFAMTEAERDELNKLGVVTMQAQYSRASSPSVTAKLTATAG